LGFKTVFPTEITPPTAGPQIGLPVTRKKVIIVLKNDSFKNLLDFLTKIDDYYQKKKVSLKKTLL